MPTLKDKQKDKRECSNSTKSRMGHALVASRHSKSNSLRHIRMKEMIRRSCSTSPIEGISQLQKDVEMLYYSWMMEVGDSGGLN